MDSRWNGTGPVRRRQAVVNELSRQAYRLDRQLAAVRSGAESRLADPRCAVAVWQMAEKQAEFGHLVAEGYRKDRYSPISALVRTLFEDATLLAWLSMQEDAEPQASRVKQVLLQYYRECQYRGESIPPDAVALIRNAHGKAARKPPSWEDRVKQLDEQERRTVNGKPFWSSHTELVDRLNPYVHSDLSGAVRYTDPRLRELLGFQAVVYGYQYLSLSVVSVARLSDQHALGARAQAAYDRGHTSKMKELRRLF
jgi:hypothetical protein